MVSVPGQGGSMSDHLALQLCAPEVLAAVWESEGCPCTSPVFVAPITRVATALSCATVTRVERVEALSVAYAICFQIHLVIEDGEAEASESAAAGKEVTNANRNHLRRLMNLCVGLFFALRTFDWEINLARLETHGIEGHFGIVRSALRGRGQWNSWKGAEASTALLRANKEKLGLKARGRASRIRIAGALALSTLDEEEGLVDSATQPGEERDTFLAAVALSVRGDEVGLEALC
jgi:uncharacterized membrane protein